MNHISEDLSTLICQFVGFKDYSSEGIAKLKAIENCIVNFSKTNHCFNVCLDILQKQPSSEVQYFASMLLKDKFKFDFDQQEPSHVQPHYLRICKIIRKYKEPTPIVLSNLSFCLVYIYMHFSGTINSPLEYFEQSIENSNSNYTLKSLQLLPEEINNTRVVIEEQMRVIAKKNMEKHQTNVLVLLGKKEQMWVDGKIDKNILLGVFSNWVGVKYNKEVMDDLIHHPFLAKAVEKMADYQLSDAACNCIAQILKEIKSEENTQLFGYISNVIDILTEKVLGLIKSGEIQIAENYVRILCDFGTKASPTFLIQPGQKTFKFLSFMLKFMLSQQINCFIVVGDFWISFMNDLRQQPLKEPFFALLKQLLCKICMRIKIGYELQMELNDVPEEKLCKLHKEADELRDRREQTRQILKQISLIIGKEAVLHEVFINLQKISQGDNQCFWESLQAYIYALSIITHSYPSYSQEIQLIVQTYQDLHPTLIAVKRSYLSFFKALITVQQKEPHHVFKLLTYIVSMLQHPLLANQAEKAFFRACQKNSKILCPNIDDFMNLLQMHSSKQNVLKGVLQVLNCDETLMKKYLGMILMFYCQKVKKGKVLGQIKQGFNSMTTIIKTISKPQVSGYEQSVKNLFMELWPIFKECFLNPPNLTEDEDPQVERCVKLIKVIMRSLKSVFSVFLKDLFSTVVEAYKKYPICSYLYLLEVSMTVYYQFPSFIDYFRQLYCTFCNITFSHLSSEEKIQQYQFLVDDFMGMNKRFFIYNAQIVLNTDKINSLLELVLLCSGSKIDKLAKESYQLLQVLYAFNWTQKMITDFNAEEDHEPILITQSGQKLYQPLRQVLLERTQMFLIKMLEHLSQCPYQSTANSILNTLMAEVKAFPKQNRSIWLSLVGAIPEDILTRKEKDIFLQILPQFQKISIQEAEFKANKILSTINKRFRNRKQRQHLK